MADVATSGEVRGISRRYFLKTTSGAVAVTILQPPLFGYSALSNAGEADPAALSPSPVPGTASQRIEGLAKVSGQKIYARDYYARDMHWDLGQKRREYYALYLRAVQTDDLFRGIDLSSLPVDAKPKYMVLGDDKKISTAMNTRDVPGTRDLHLDHIMEATKSKKTARSGEGFDRPHSLDLDLIVKPGNRADFLGQAVALLIFDSRANYRAARRFMQFRDADFQIYEVTTKDAPARPPFHPITDYVLWPKTGNTPGFSYAGYEGEKYLKDAQPFVEKIEKFIGHDSKLIQQTFSADMSAMDPMFMEPEAGLAWYEEKPKTLHLVLGTQSPDGDVKEVSSMYGELDSPLKVKKVELTSCYPGGGFGGRDKSPFTLLLATAAAFADGHPVRLEYDRFDQFRVGLKRHACRLDGTLVVSPDQAMKVIEMKMTFDGGGRKNLSPYVANLAALCAGGSYAVPMAKIHAQADPSKNISGGSQRGFGGPQAFFGIETALDDIAARKGWDPIEFRRKNILRKGGQTVAGGTVRQELQLDEMLKIARDHALWDQREMLKKDYGDGNLAYGTGVAMSLQGYGTSGDGVVAAVLMDEMGRFTVQSDAVDMGNGSATTLGVVIGDILGANASKVEMGGYKLFAQTNLGIFGYGVDRTWNSEPQKTAKAVGSSSACLTGLHQVHIMQQVAHAYFAEAILPAARNLWSRQDVTDAAWDKNGNLTIRDGRRLPLSELAREVYDKDLARGAVGHAFFQGFWASADYDLKSGRRNFEMDGLAFYRGDALVPDSVNRLNAKGPPIELGRESRFVWSPCVNVVGLTVNTKSGAVQIENVLSVLNAGRIHVEPLVKGQSQGGIAQAIGWTLMESVPTGIHGPANGKWNLNVYHVPRWQDVPLATEFKPGGRSQELILMSENPGDNGQGRGIAEAVMCSIAPAISNALRDAVGKRYTSLPITPDKILRGLQS